MASEALRKAITSYDEWIEKNGLELEIVNAYVDALGTAFLGEKDIPYALESSKKAKKYIDGLIFQQTERKFSNHKGVYFWGFEKFCQERDIERNSIIQKGFDIYKWESPYRFESFCFYMDKNRKYEKRFYVPRRNTLSIVAQDLQDMEDDKLDGYGLSMPSRVGKSTICIYFLTWVGYRKPDSHNAMGGHSGQLAKRFFKGLSNLVETPEYTYSELFNELYPDLSVVQYKSSDPAEYSINLGNPDEFSTFTCRGIDGTWTGAVDVSSDGYLYVDDLIRDREHSLSPSREENTYQEFQNKMLDRMNDGAKELMVGTLWNVGDPLERERRLHEGDDRWRFRKIPALNEKDESNFQYEYKGFSTSYYINMRDRLEKAEWMAKFQQAPFVREGLTFPIEELRFFDGVLPDGLCRTVAICDAAFGGGDSLSMPICKDFEGNDKYIVGWVHDKRSPEYTVPKVVDAIERYGITLLWFEKNSGGQLLAEKIQKEMDARYVAHCKIELYSAPVRMHKEEKISGHSDYVKRNFLFLLPKAKKLDIEDDVDIYFANEDYRKAIDEMTMWSAEGKKQHDDAPDAIASLAMKMTKMGNATIEAITNPFRHRR